MASIMLMPDPRVGAIPVADWAESLVDVRGALPIDDRGADPTGAFAHPRRRVLDHPRADLILRAISMPKDLTCRCADQPGCCTGATPPARANRLVRATAVIRRHNHGGYLARAATTEAAGMGR